MSSQGQLIIETCNDENVSTFLEWALEVNFIIIQVLWKSYGCLSIVQSNGCNQANIPPIARVRFMYGFLSFFSITVTKLLYARLLRMVDPRLCGSCTIVANFYACSACHFGLLLFLCRTAVIAHPIIVGVAG